MIKHIAVFTTKVRKHQIYLMITTSDLPFIKQWSPSPEGNTDLPQFKGQSDRGGKCVISQRGTNVFRILVRVALCVGIPTTIDRSTIKNMHNVWSKLSLADIPQFCHRQNLPHAIEGFVRIDSGTPRCGAHYHMHIEQPTAFVGVCSSRCSVRISAIVWL